MPRIHYTKEGSVRRWPGTEVAGHVWRESHKCAKDNGKSHCRHDLEVDACDSGRFSVCSVGQIEQHTAQTRQTLGVRHQRLRGLTSVSEANGTIWMARHQWLRCTMENENTRVLVSSRVTDHIIIRQLRQTQIITISIESHQWKETHD